MGGAATGLARWGLAVILVCILLIGSVTIWPENMPDAFAATSVAHAADSCLVEITGDVNVDGAVTSTDIIYLLNFIFIRGPDPEPCVGSGDVTCDSRITSGDVIYLVNYVFKSGPEPCDVCESESAIQWNCIL